MSADEASAALDHRPELAKLKGQAKAVEVPGGGTLYDWVKAFLGAGDEIDKLLRERAKLLASGPNAAGTGPLREATVGLLGRFREALRDEIEEDGEQARGRLRGAAVRVRGQAERGSDRARAGRRRGTPHDPEERREDGRARSRRRANPLASPELDHARRPRRHRRPAHAHHADSPRRLTPDGSTTLLAGPSAPTMPPPIFRGEAAEVQQAPEQRSHSGSQPMKCHGTIGVTMSRDDRPPQSRCDDPRSGSLRPPGTALEP